MLDIASSLLTYFITGRLYILTHFTHLLPIPLLPLAPAILFTYLQTYLLFLAVLCDVQDLSSLDSRLYESEPAPLRWALES